MEKTELVKKIYEIIDNLEARTWYGDDQLVYKGKGVKFPNEEEGRDLLIADLLDLAGIKD